MERRRALPPWMSKEGEKEKQPLKSRRKRKVARAVFYCMNERELVEAAVSCLTDIAREDVTSPLDHQVGSEAGGTTARKRQKTSLKTNPRPVTDVLEEDSSNCEEVLEKTCVSETDSDITEMENLPKTKRPEHSGAEGRTSGPVQDVIDVKLEQEKKKQQCPQKKADDKQEDEALKLVREIFFTK